MIIEQSRQGTQEGASWGGYSPFHLRPVLKEVSGGSAGTRSCAQVPTGTQGSKPGTPVLSPFLLWGRELAFPWASVTLSHTLQHIQ